MKFKTLKNFKKIVSISGLITIFGGSILIPIIYDIKNKNSKKKKQINQPKKVKEIKKTNPKNKLIENNNKIFEIMNNIASDEIKWNNLKKIIVENIDFQKEKFSSSKINIDKLNLNYKIKYFEKIENILYIIDKWEISDGKIKIFGHIKKNNWKVTIKPFLVADFLTKKQNNIKKINLLNASWIKSIITINQNIEKYSIISKDRIKNIIFFNLQNQKILNIKIKIENFLINKNVGKLSFRVDIYYLNKKIKTINVIYDNLQKDIISEIKNINSYYLEDNIFNFFDYNNLYYEDIDFENYLSLIKKLDLIKKNKANVFLNNKIYKPLNGELSFEIQISKKGYKTHVIKMFYNNLIKKLTLDWIQNFKKEIQKIDGITFTKENTTNISLNTNNKNKIKNYFKLKYPNWNLKIRNIRRYSYNFFEYKLFLRNKEYIPCMIKISYQIPHYIELDFVK